MGRPKLAATLEEAGFAVRPLGFSEFIKSGGSAKCLTLRIDGEEAASWKQSVANRITQGQETDMKELYIVRHGIAVEQGTPGLSGRRAALDGQGRKADAANRPLALRKLDLKLDRIVTSPLPRARATAQIVAEELEARNRLEIANVLQAGSSAASIQRWLRGRTEDRLMVVGHNPSLSDLVSLLVMGNIQSSICDLKKGGIAALNNETGAGDQYDIAWIATPR